MTDILAIYARFGKEFFLKREDEDHHIEMFSHLLDPFLSPCPDVRGDVIDNRDTEGMNFFCDTKIKAGVVEKDERDLGLRNILNYGHTLGHAIETVSGLTVRHGPAVAIGMVIAGRISNRLGMFGGEEQSRLERLVQRAGLPTEPPVPDVSGIIRAMEHDKKIRNGRIRFVLPKSIGKVFVADEVTPALVEQVLVGPDHALRTACRS